MFNRTPAKKRKLHNESKAFPKFFLNHNGKSAQISSKCKSGEILPLQYADIANFILHASTPSHFQRKPYWCELIRLQKLVCFGVIVIEDIGLGDLLSCTTQDVTDYNIVTEDKLQCLHNLLSISQAGVAVQPPKLALSDCLAELYHIKSTTIRKTALTDNSPSSGFYSAGTTLREDLQLLLVTEDKFDRRELLLSTEQLEALQFPLQKEGCKFSDDVDMKMSRTSYREVTSTSPMYAVDCEMVQTENDAQALAQISIVDENLKLIYSSVVKPPGRILNYLTYYSGLTDNDFVGIYTQLKDVQSILSQLLPSDAILVGHSVTNDLAALKIRHPYCIDTALLYSMVDWKQRPSLKSAVKYFLDVNIQNRSRIGHDPTEDAIAAMLLVKKKLSNDIKFGDVRNGWKRKPTVAKPIEENICTDIPKQNILQIISKISSKPSIVMKPGVTSNLFEDTYATVINEATNDDIFKKISALSMTEKLIISHIKIEDKSSSLTTKIEKLDSQIKELYKSLPLRFMLMVFFTGTFSNADSASNGCAFISVKNSH